jgi:hypothetical protein
MGQIGLPFALTLAVQCCVLGCRRLCQGAGHTSQAATSAIPQATTELFNTLCLLCCYGAGGCAKVQATPAKLPWAKKMVQLSASLDGHFAAAIDATGHLYTWGAGACHAFVISVGVM